MRAKLFFLSMALLISLPAAAVSCGSSSTVGGAYERAAEVFSAHVEEIYTAPGFGREAFKYAKLRVIRVFKGSMSSGAVVSATAEDSINFVSDGLDPAPGSEVLVYAVGPQPFVLNTCARNAPLENNSDVRELEQLSNQPAQE
ncbi:MAG: hypothetical protein KDI71_23055 [Xanthomonadales bacterium]|nr:hypothetical protein [Xanthomonadales bacterium]